jgi:CRISPR/Cas system-associated exonuclease Cas4 (RecB family)
VAKLPKPHISGGLALGAAVHRTLAAYHRAIRQGAPFGSDQVHAAFLGAWEETEVRETIQFRDGEDRTKLTDQGVALLELYTKEPVTDEIVAVEEELLVPLFTSRGEALEQPLLAVPDLLIRNSEGLTVTEFKTSGRRYNELEADASLQASCYVHAVKDRYSEEPRVRYTILVKTKTPQIQHLETVRNDADTNRLGDIVETVERAIRAQAFYPVESAMNCSTCPFFRPCREWRSCPACIEAPLESDEKEIAVQC